jgi:UDP-N-acetylmuramate--alanine ligase
MNLKNLHTVYFLGVGGIGMSAIARYFNSLDCKVVGYDKTQTNLTKKLASEGIEIHYEENLDLIPLEVKEQQEGTLVIYTPAIPKNNTEFIYLKEQGIRLWKRSEVLGLISQNYFTIAVAGTHGKTTTSSIVAHILNECGVNCIAFLGGISLNFNSNLLLNENTQTSQLEEVKRGSLPEGGDSKNLSNKNQNRSSVFVVEADEYDRSFLTLSPDIALITSIDADHLDIYGDENAMKEAYSEFAGKIKKGGKLISKPFILEELSLRSDVGVSSYSVTENADTFAQEVRIEEGNYVVDIQSAPNSGQVLLAQISRTTTSNVKIGLPGIHNVENAIGAFAIGEKLGIDPAKIKTALASFKGVYRRFETHVKTKDIVYIDDYAHHPSELEMTIKSAKELYPGKKITAIFQPHLYTRTRDFLEGFAASLSLLDELLLLDIYPARELPIAGVSAQIILDKVTCTKKKMVTKEGLLAAISIRNIEVLLTLGAGDIDVFVQPIKEQLLKKKFPLRGDLEGL